MKERFIKLPLERATIWESLSWFQRALGADMFRAFQEREQTFGRTWETVVCGALCVPGRERGNVVRALRGLVEAGVLIVDGGRLRLLYSESSYQAFHSAPAPTPPSVPPTSGDPPPDVDQTSADTPPYVHSASSPRNHSGQVLQIDREIERETHRSACTPERVCAREADGPPERESPRLAASVELRFRSLYLERFEVEPATGGEPAAGFPGRLASTAAARRMEPLALLELAFGLWVDAGRPGLGRADPYTAFVQRFAELLAPSSATRAATAPSAATRIAELRKRELELETAAYRSEPAELASVRAEQRELRAEIAALAGGAP